MRPSTGTACAWEPARSIPRSRRCRRSSIPWSSTSNISDAKATCRCSWCCAKASCWMRRCRPASTRPSKPACRAASCPTRSSRSQRFRARSPARSRSCRSRSSCSATPSRKSSTRTRWPIRAAWRGIWNLRRAIWRGLRRKDATSSIVVLLRKLDLVLLLAGVELHDLARHAREDRGDRIHTQHRCAWGAHHLIGNGEQALIVTVAEDGAEHRDLAEYVVAPIERHEGAAHAPLVGFVVQRALDGAADRRPLRHALAHGELAVLAAELGAQAREEDA